MKLIEVTGGYLFVKNTCLTNMWCAHSVHFLFSNAVRFHNLKRMTLHLHANCSIRKQPRSKVEEWREAYRTDSSAVSDNKSNILNVGPIVRKFQWKTKSEVKTYLVNVSRFAKINVKGLGGFNIESEFVPQVAGRIDDQDLEKCIAVLTGEDYDKLNVSIKVLNQHYSRTFHCSSAVCWWNEWTVQHERKRTILTPINHYMEILRWLEQSLMPVFPLRNEDGLEMEKEVPFHEHLLLDKLLPEGCPSQSAVMKFMKAVTCGLSINPHLTIYEKRDHINWFKKYFSEEGHTLLPLSSVGDSRHT